MSVEIVVVRGRGENAKYVRNPEATGKFKLAPQANDVYEAITDEPAHVSEIALRLETHTKQKPERIVRYYLPQLLKLELITKR